MKKVLIAMSHQLTTDQVADLEKQGFVIKVSQVYKDSNCNILSPSLSSEELKAIAKSIVDEAADCTAIAMTGEPMLTFHVWNVALELGLSVLQSTTKRDTVETVNADGSVVKTQVFKHVQWRKL